MGPFRIPAVLIAGFLLAGGAMGQQSLPSVTIQSTSLQPEVSRGPDGRPRVTLNNTYKADARAYIIECDYPGPNGETLAQTVVHEGIGGPPYTVWAGKTQSIACPLTTSQAVVRAVAFDDGKTEGDPQSLAQVAAERQLEAQDVAEDIQLLQNALASLGNNPSSIPGTASSIQVSQLSTQFVQRAQQHANTALVPLGQDFVCSGIAQMLGSPIHKQPITILIQGYIAELQKFAAVLPKPVQPPAPSGVN